MSDHVATTCALAELAGVRRSGFLESRHLGSVVGLGRDGTVVVEVGDPAGVILPRSSAKPLQAVGCLDTGVTLSLDQLAIAAGSHTGEDRHVDLVRRTLGLARLDESALQCPVDWPEDEPTRNRLIADGAQRSAVRMNCSGKHAAMLAACVANGWDTTTYLDAAHPVQQAVRTAVERTSAEAVRHVAVDGCGAPLFGISLVGLARAAHRLATAPGGSTEARVAHAMRAAPALVGGREHANTELMRRVPGAICKGGAEGVLMAAAATGEAVAVKVVDGSPRATTVIVLAVLEAMGVDVSAAADLSLVPVLGGGQPVGRIELGPDLATALKALRGTTR